jgi:hypothetical protein
MLMTITYGVEVKHLSIRLKYLPENCSIFSILWKKGRNTVLRTSTATTRRVKKLISIYESINKEKNVFSLFLNRNIILRRDLDINLLKYYLEVAISITETVTLGSEKDAHVELGCSYFIFGIIRHKKLALGLLKPKINFSFRKEQHNLLTGCACL